MGKKHTLELFSFFVLNSQNKAYKETADTKKHSAVAA